MKLVPKVSVRVYSYGIELLPALTLARHVLVGTVLTLSWLRWGLTFQWRNPTKIKAIISGGDFS